MLLLRLQLARVAPCQCRNVTRASAAIDSKSTQALTPRQRRLALQKKKWEEGQSKQAHASQPETSQPAAPSAHSSSAKPAPAAAKAADKAQGSTGARKPEGSSNTSTPKSVKAANNNPAGAKPANHSKKGVTLKPAAPAQAPQAAAQQQTFVPWSVFDQQPAARLSHELRQLTGDQLAQLALHWAEQVTQVQVAHADACAEGSMAAAGSLWPLLTPEQQANASVGVSALAAEALQRLAAHHPHAPAADSPEAASTSGRGADSSRTSNSKAKARSTSPPQQLQLSRQAHADIEWSVAHFRSAPPATRIPDLASALHEAMGVPFRVLPLALPYVRLERLVAEVSLRRDTILLDNGTRAVEEVRLTGWQSDIGATFKYSGKEMVDEGGGMTREVAAVRDALAGQAGQVYDSVLINYYEDGRCGMRYHVDPLYGCWTPNSAVVSVGAARRFAFREMKDQSIKWMYRVRNGDTVLMYGECQDRLQHSVVVEKLKTGPDGQLIDPDRNPGPRMSLVMKQRIPGM